MNLRAVLEKLGLPEMTWYQATRHAFASQWVLSGNSIEMLADILGHSSVQVTQRYAHMRPDLYSERVMGALDVDLEAPVDDGSAEEAGEHDPETVH